jgi:hypothetical protein
MFLHTYHSWLLTQLLQPFLWILFSFFVAGDNSSLDPDTITIILFISFFSLLCSIPCLLLSWGALYLITQSPFTVFGKFCLWITAVLFIAVSAFVIVLLSQQERILLKDFLLITPTIGATTLAILIRHNQFQKLIYSTETNYHETNLV